MIKINRASLQKLGQIVFANWGAKLLALVLAFGLWAFVVNSGFRQAVLPEPIPVTARDIEEGLAVAGPLPNVTVEVWAPTASFQRLKTKDLHATINLAGLEAGQHTLEVKVFADDPNVRILDIIPHELTITLEKLRSEEFELKFETEGQLGQGYVADKAELKPARVKAQGAQTILAQIDQVVARLTLNGETSTVERTVAPIALDQDRNTIPGVMFEPSEVKIKLPIIQAEDVKTVGIQVQTKGEPAEGFFVGKITSNPTTANALGSSKALAGITTLKTEPINLAGATQNVTRTAKLVLPPNVSADPAEVSVTIEIKAGNLSTELTLTPDVINVSPGLVARVEPGTITVTISGLANLVRDYESSNPKLTLDANGKAEGEYPIVLTSEMLGLPSGLRANFATGGVTLTLTST